MSDMKTLKLKDTALTNQYVVARDIMKKQIKQLFDNTWKLLMILLLMSGTVGIAAIAAAIFILASVGAATVVTAILQ